MSITIDRLNSLCLRELSMILNRDSKNEYLNSVTITEVRITNDLSYANIYYTCPKTVTEQTKDALEKSKGYLRKELAPRLKARKMPELVFKFDEALEYGNHISEILASLNK